MTRRVASLLLLLTAIIWGLSFVAQDVSADLIGPFTFNASRFYIGALALLPFILYKRRGKVVSKEQNKKTLKGGLCCGIALAVASVLQQAGVATTGAGKAGFITSLYNIFVPLFLLFMGRKIDKKIWLYALLAVVGMYLLCIKEGFRVESGDYLVLSCAVFFAIHILIIDHFSKDVDGVEMSAMQFLTAAIICTFGALIGEKIILSDLVKAAVPVLYAGIFSCGIAYTLQVVAQKYVHPAAATLILSLESVVSVLAGWLILGAALNARELLGCAIVFIAVILSQLSTQKST